MKRGDGYPAGDLIYQGKTLTPERAYELARRSGLDLSTLDPDPTTNVWTGVPSTADAALDEALPVKSGDRVAYQGFLETSSGLFKLNAKVEGQPLPLTFLLSMRMHTYLLRRELLRRLGYQIPAIKFLPRVEVLFPDAKSRDEVLLKQIPFNAIAPATHWCRVSPPVQAALQEEYQRTHPESKALYPCVADPALTGTDPLAISFQDVAVMPATAWFYNVDYGPPIDVVPGTSSLRPQAQRIFRVLALIYALVDVPESINQLDWNVGFSRDNNYSFTLPDQVNFGCTQEDAVWLLRRAASLSRQDFAQVISGGAYPDAVAKVLLEKVIARRNSLMKAFRIETPELAFDPKPTLLPGLKEGKILQKSWPGYANDFALGDPKSPLRGLHWYALSLLQSNAMSEVFRRLSNLIPNQSIQEVGEAHSQKLYQKALDEFLKTGAPQPVKFGVWAAPIAGGMVQIDRSVVFGNYLGTNNLVQLADTFAVGGNVGLFVGFDAVPSYLKVQGMVQAQASVSFTRVKPLANLKQGLTERLDRTFVPWITAHVSSLFKAAATDAKTASTIHTDGEFDQLRDKISKDLNDLKELLGVGESLLVSYNVTGSQALQAALGLSIPLSPSVGVGLGADQIAMHRLNFFRKDQNTLQIFKDNGRLAQFSLSAEFSFNPRAQLPVISFAGKTGRGEGDMEVFSLNINPDVRRNPSFESVAIGISNALRWGTTSTLAAASPSGKTNVTFHDSSKNFRFLHWVHRSLKTQAKTHAVLPDKSAGDFLVLSDGSQNGKHYQKLLTEAGSYLLQRLLNGAGKVDTHANENPGQSFFGSSETRNIELQAALETQEGGAQKVSSPFLKLTRRWEGWQLSVQDAWKIIDEQSRHFGFDLYPQGFFGDTKKLKLYELNVALVFYEAGLSRLMGLGAEAEKALEDRYFARNLCDLYWDADGRRRMTAEQMEGCYALLQFKDAYAKFQKGDKDPAKTGKAMLTAVKWMERFVDFRELVELAGGSENLWVSSSISGFREGSEEASESVQSQTYGSCLQPDLLHCAPGTSMPLGVVDVVEQFLGVQDGEFRLQWLREVL